MHERAEALPRGGVPDADEPVPGAADDEGAVVDEVDAADGVRVRGQAAHDARGAHVPDEDGFVVGAADEHVAARGEGEGVDVVVVAEEGERVGVPGEGVPEADGFVVGAGGEGDVVGGPGEGGDAGEVGA